MSNQIRGKWDDVRSSDHELILKYDSQFKNAVQVQQANIDRSMRNWRAYMAVSGMSWPKEDSAKLLNEGRTPMSFDIIEGKVDTLAGALSSEKFDFDYKPLSGPRTTLNDACVASWYADKDKCHYDANYAKAIKYAMIINSEMEMKMSTRYDPMTNIALHACEPGTIVSDPTWKTSDDRDRKLLWKKYFLNALQIKQVFGTSSPEIDNYIRQWRRDGNSFEDYGSEDLDFYSELNRGVRGHLFPVIEQHWMETIKTSRIIGKKMGKTLYIPFPITTDHNKLHAFMVKNDIDPMTMKESGYNDEIHHYAAWSLDLTPKFLSNGISKMQPKRLPFFHLTANRFQGIDKGIVDNLIDLNQTIDKRETKLTEIIVTAGGGGILYKKGLFKNPTEEAKFKEGKADPRFAMGVDDDELDNNAIHYLNQNAYNPQIIDQIQRMYDTVDRLSKVPAAMDAMSESSNESGVLFERKLQVSRMGLITLIDGVKEYRHNIHEAYMEQWMINDAYNNEEREMTNDDNKYSVILNKRVFKDGQMFIQNRPSQMPRSRVVITESRSSPTRKMLDQARYSELYDRAVQTNPDQAAIWYKALIGTMEDEFSDELKAEYRQMAFLETIKSKKKVLAEIATFNAQEKEAALAAMQSVFQLEQAGGTSQEQAILSEMPAGDVSQPVEDVPPEEAEPGFMEQTENVLVEEGG